MLNFRIEKRLAKRTGKTIVAMDEAGRGPIAGPIAVGVVLLDENFYRRIKKKDKWWRFIDDSKKLNPKNRQKMFDQIERNLIYGVGMASAEYIDKHGIVKATQKAAQRALKKISAQPQLILVDGNRKFINHKNCSERAVVRGDSRIWGIACASIAAKVTRDDYMTKAAKRYPKYKFQLHKGYGTAMHLNIIGQFGPCILHRFSFAPVKNHGSRKSFYQTKHENGRN
jgi:ribonuclease HII